MAVDKSDSGFFFQVCVFAITYAKLKTHLKKKYIALQYEQKAIMMIRIILLLLLFNLKS